MTNEESNNKIIELRKKLEQRESLKEEYDKLDSHLKKLRQEIAELLHEIKINHCLIKTRFGAIDCNYISKKSKSVDYDLLFNVVNTDLYHQIVKEKKSSYIKISKKKEDPEFIFEGDEDLINLDNVVECPKDDLTKKKPNENDFNISDNIPSGTLS